MKNNTKKKKHIKDPFRGDPFHPFIKSVLDACSASSEIGSDYVIEFKNENKKIKKIKN